MTSSNPIPKPAKVTIKELAKALDLSPMAVSVALNGSSGTVRVSEKTVKRVRELAEAWKYKPNAGARAIRARQFKNIGFFDGANPSSNTSLPSIEMGICDGAISHDFNVTLVRMPSTRKEGDDPSVPRVFREYQVDALLVTNTHLMSKDLHERIATCGCPVIYVNEKHAFNAVYSDDYPAFRQLAINLSQQGFTKIAYLGPKADTENAHYSVKDRALGYTDGIAAAGLEPIVFDHPEPSVEAECLNPYSWLTSDSRPEVVICYDDAVAMQFQRMCNVAKIRIPEDISITGCGGGFLTSLSTVPLSTLEIPWAELGRAASQMAIEMVQNKKEQSLSQSFSPAFVEGSSVTTEITTKV